MSDTPETVRAVTAEMRMRARCHSNAADIIEWAVRIDKALDRLEAAVERERDEADERIRNAWTEGYCMDPDKSAPGNAAALREAMKRIAWESRNAINSKTNGVERANVLATYLMDFRDTADAALSAPARNCDRFATEDEAREAYWAYREPLEFNDKPFVAITEWLFATAEGGEK